MPSGRKIESMLVIDLLEKAAAIVAYDVDLDADLTQRLLNEGGKQRDILAPWRRKQAQGEARSAARLESGFIQQLHGERLVVGILGAVVGRIEVRRHRRDRSGPSLG